ncbi:hypothetical protein BGZ76_010879 [Entomortierella beljakovae]|nr:hypothetical protein BGZ76_010879 [Entomortierella beljakovae]
MSDHLSVTAGSIDNQDLNEMNPLSTQDTLTEENQNTPFEWKFLLPDQRRTIDWSRYSKYETFHSRNYNPHQGIPHAILWSKYMAIPSITSAIDDGTETNYEGRENSIWSPETLNALRRPPLEYGAPRSVNRTSISNPTPISALEPFHAKDLEDWNTNLVDYVSSYNNRSICFRGMLDDSEKWRLAETRLNESVDRFKILLEGIDTADDLMEDSDQISNTVRSLFSFTGESDSYQNDTLGSQDLSMAAKSILSDCVRASIQIFDIKVGLKDEVNAVIQTIHNTRRVLYLDGIFKDIPDTYEAFQDGYLIQGPYAGLSISDALKSNGRPSYLTNLIFIPRLGILDSNTRLRLNTVKANEDELEERLYLFHIAADLSILENGVKVKYVKSIKTPIALQSLNTSSVCCVRRLEVDFERVGWSGEYWRTSPEKYSMPAGLKYQMENQENSDADVFFEEMTIEKCLDTGHQIVSRNISTLEDLSWNGPICQGCFFKNGHDSDHVGAHSLDIGDVFRKALMKEATESKLSPLHTSTKSDLQHLTPPPLLSTTNCSRLAILSLSSWSFTRSSLIMILEFCPHLISLEMQKCLLEDRQVSAGTASIPTSSTASETGTNLDNVPAFQHRGLRVLITSMSTLFSQARREAFYDVLNNSAKRTEDTSIHHEESQPPEEKDDLASDRSSYRKSTTPEPYDKDSLPGPNMITQSQAELIELLEPSILHLFPNLEHWKLAPGFDNSRLVPWIGTEIQKYCPNLNKLTVLEAALPDPETTALLVRIFRPMSVNPAESNSPAANPRIPLDEENDPENLLVRKGYRLAQGKGLKLFRSEERMYSLSLIRSLILHSSSLEILDLDASDEYWNMFQGQRDGLFDPLPLRSGLSDYGSDIGLNDDTVNLTDPELLESWLHLTVDERGYEADNEIDTKSYGVRRSQPIPDRPASFASAISPAPSTLLPFEESYDVRGVDEGPRCLRQSSPDLDTLLRQLTRVRHLKLPRNIVDTSDTLFNPYWQCAGSLEELWLSFKSLDHHSEISQIMKDIGATPVKKFWKMTDSYDNPEGISPLPVGGFNNQEEGDEFIRYELAYDNTSIESSHQLQEYMNRILYHEGEEGYIATKSSRDENKDKVRERGQTGNCSARLGCLERKALRSQVMNFLVQFNRLRYVWIGDGLYQLPPKVLQALWEISSDNGGDNDDEGLTRLYMGLPDHHF